MSASPHGAGAGRDLGPPVRESNFQARGLRQAVTRALAASPTPRRPRSAHPAHLGRRDLNRRPRPRCAVPRLAAQFDWWYLERTLASPNEPIQVCTPNLTSGAHLQTKTILRHPTVEAMWRSSPVKIGQNGADYRLGWFSFEEIPDIFDMHPETIHCRWHGGNWDGMHAAACWRSDNKHFAYTISRNRKVLL